MVTELPIYDDVIEQQGPTEEDLKSLTSLVEEKLRLDIEIAELDETIKKKNKQLRKIEESDIPEIMNKAGIEKFTTSGGTEVSIKESIRASLTEATKEKAFEWLKNNGHGAIIKTSFLINIGPDQEKEFEKLKALKALSKFPDKKEKGEIHHQTLKAFIKREMEKDKSFPLSIFNGFKHQVAKIKTKK